jgi:nitrate/TMAO reductase-like tetraheme cytochrome c subunit
MAKRRFPEVVYNPLSVGGAALAAASFLTIIFLTAVEIFQERSPAYIGIISYIALPVPLVIGLLIIPIGILRERRRLRKGLPASTLHFSVDLGDTKQRRAVSLFASVTGIFLLFTAYGSYRAFEWTESVSFCGSTCHPVMQPENTAYQDSPHARVKCVDCHVGPGAGWYVRSKLSGAYQVYAVAANVYPRPIPTPIKNLRPAQETCEQCHWPSHFSGQKEVVNTYFRSDTLNTRWTVALLMKIGGGNSPRGPESGIHWHMNINNEITYVTTDSLHQVIPWVRATNRTTGESVEFKSADMDLAQASLDSLQKNRMDCIDCHNRPSHIYRPPVRIVDQSLTFGRISTELPEVRAAAIQALVAPYSSSAAAMDSIPKIFTAFYQERYPQVAERKKELIAKAAGEIQGQYRKNFFPEMGVSWKVYPNNIGHMTDIGCFRCHDGKHVTTGGRVISKDCNSCHTILYQGSDPVPATLNAGGLPFQHPVDVGDAWKEMNCRECHSGQ